MCAISHLCLREKRHSPTTRLFNSRRDPCVANGKIVPLALRNTSRCARGQNAVTLPAERAGATPRTFWATESRKSGVAPAQSGVFLCVTFLILVSFISSLSRDLCASQAEEDAEDEAEVRNSYLLQLLCPHSRRAHQRSFLLGWSDPRLTLGTEPCAKVGSSSPTRSHSAAILCILSCVTSTPSGTCSIAKVGAKVTDRVICVFHVRVTFDAGNAFETLCHWHPSITKEALKTEKVRNKVWPELLRPRILIVFPASEPITAISDPSTY
jgi:hypothetical protein